MGSEKRERPTSEVASMLGVLPDNLNKWKLRGLLKKAPSGVSGQGRGVECFWSEEAIEEARHVMATRKPTKLRTRRPALSPAGQGGRDE